jgi:type VI secretion system protein ImpE
MDIKELIRANKLTEARSKLVEVVKGAPSDQGMRTLLFQVLLFFGEWDKAERHLDILAMQNARSETGVQVYKNLIIAERIREEVHAGKARPSFMGTAPPYLDKYFVAWEKLSAGDGTGAAALYGEIEAEEPEISGVFEDREFKGFRDIDAFLSGFLEIFVHDRYLWMPFTSLRELTIPEPKTLFDLLWIPANVTTWEGLTSACFLPVLYPGSSSSENDMVRLGKMTEWKDLGDGFWKGGGQHVFQMGDEEKALLELREIRFNLA